MFGRMTRSRPRAADAAAPTGSDWSPHRRLEEAAAAYLIHPQTALEAIRGVLGRRRVRGFTLERVVDITEDGASLWQEAAVVDRGRLILWHGEDLTADDLPGIGEIPDGGGLLDSSLQVVPLSAVTHIGLRTLVLSDAAGRRSARAAHLVVATGTPHELLPVPAAGGEDGPSAARFRPEAFRFSKTVDDDGAGQVARLVEFGRTLSRLAPHAAAAVL